MTLAVAGCFPWRRELAIANSLPPGADVTRCVVLATDSRFSYQGGERIDVGRKVYVLEPHVALVYAGDVTAAQRAISDIQHFIGKRTPGSQAPMTGVVQQFLQQAYAKARDRKSRLRKRSLQPLRVLIGVYDHRTLRPHVVAYSSDSNFVPMTGDRVHALGAEVDVRNFGEALLRRNREREHLADNSIDWQFDVVLAMRSALEARGRTATIGGLVQSVVIDAHGISETSFSFTAGDPTDESSWRPATTRIADVKQDRPSYPGRHDPAAVLVDLDPW